MYLARMGDWFEKMIDAGGTPAGDAFSRGRWFGHVGAAVSPKIHATDRLCTTREERWLS